jgi:hypothetical protein
VQLTTVLITSSYLGGSCFEFQVAIMTKSFTTFPQSLDSDAIHTIKWSVAISFLILLGSLFRIILPFAANQETGNW